MCFSKARNTFYDVGCMLAIDHQGSPMRFAYSSTFLLMSKLVHPYFQIPSDDIRWVHEDPGLSHGGAPGDKRSMNHTGAVPSAGRKRQYRSEVQNGTGNMTDDIEILHTDTLIKEVYI